MPRRTQRRSPSKLISFLMLALCMPAGVMLYTSYCASFIPSSNQSSLCRTVGFPLTEEKHTKSVRWAQMASPKKYKKNLVMMIKEKIVLISGIFRLGSADRVQNFLFDSLICSLLYLKKNSVLFCRLGSGVPAGVGWHHSCHQRLHCFVVLARFGLSAKFISHHGAQLFIKRLPAQAGNATCGMNRALISDTA